MLENAKHERRPDQLSSHSDLADFIELTGILGAGYGTENLCLFLHSLVRMHRPATIVELGTGFGASALSMALAARMNGRGQVWTVDGHQEIENLHFRLGQNRERLESTRWAGLATMPASEVLSEVSRRLRLEDRLTVIKRTMSLDVPGHFDDYPFADPVDLLFSDFNHGPRDVLRILQEFMPRMAPSSSIFIDSASTAWSSYLLLERIVDQFNAGHVPAVLQEGCRTDLGARIRNTRVVLVHLTRSENRVQNSTAWLKFEPIDLQPYPKTFVVGLSD